MTEYELVDDYFKCMWNTCLLLLHFDPQFQNQNAVLMDIARSKCDQILDIVQDLVAERDGLLTRVDNAVKALKD